MRDAEHVESTHRRITALKSVRNKNSRGNAKIVSVEPGNAQVKIMGKSCISYHKKGADQYAKNYEFCVIRNEISIFFTQRHSKSRLCILL